MTPFKVSHIDHVVLRILDMDRSLEFYTEKLGCPIQKRRDDLGMIHLAAGSSLIDLVDLNGPLGREGGGFADHQHSNVDHVCLRIEPFVEEDILQYLASVGVPAEKAATRYGAEGNGPSIYCHDPDGNKVELKGPPVSGPRG
ncbi:Catechol 2,3-dioxygenase [Pseudomonas sp. NFACC32-1]|jgi:catechol 2,3-dioxygenase-like lactoylglutathione lyase family enzyme|uniref:VOC family protein n=1 Tax=Pseudomonas TaxID=286 RepID=UPI000875F202|nr:MULTISPECIES: VOC family protein [Pseudomonas]MDT8908212.1 VOC family protein [Pseudomonas prosekii]NHN70931.1 VOC family protein [Pseudomonas fluorescens]ROO40650.1 lactoylglutathione lyase [Pseudomonas sp. 7SR1]ROO43207.1 lactoylglutathione lyase [Pseudomonas sp. AF76]SCX63328.1 Catechol 2,3-dioxygenase [Pseudomonas sp. NFACC32-1]